MQTNDKIEDENIHGSMLLLIELNLELIII